MGRETSPTPFAFVVACTCAMWLAMTPVHAQNTTTTLPRDVFEAFQQAYPGSVITKTAQQREGDRLLVRIDATRQGRRQVVLYEANGKLVELAEEVSEKDLPGAVAAAMHSHPRAIYVSGFKMTRGKSVHYDLTLRGTRKTAMVVQPDGIVVSFR